MARTAFGIVWGHAATFGRVAAAACVQAFASGRNVSSVGTRRDAGKPAKHIREVFLVGEAAGKSDLRKRFALLKHSFRLLDPQSHQIPVRWHARRFLELDREPSGAQA